MLNPPIIGKIQGFSRPLSLFFQVLYKANLNFKDFSNPQICKLTFCTLLVPVVCLDFNFWVILVFPFIPHYNKFVYCFDSLHPSQHFFSHVVTGLPGLNKY